MSKVTLRGYMVVPETDLPAVAAELDSHIELTLAEAGCLVFEVSQDTSDLSRFNVYEEFRDEASFRQHQKRVRTSRWGSVTTDIERHYKVQGVEDAQ